MVGLSGADCTWTAVSDAPTWITVTAGNGGPGGTLSYTIASNATSSISRTGTITLSTPISQTTFTITQSGAVCSYSLQQSTKAFTSAGGTGSVTVAAPAGCAWTAGNGASPFVNFTSGADGLRAIDSSILPCPLMPARRAPRR